MPRAVVRSTLLKGDLLRIPMKISTALVAALLCLAPVSALAQESTQPERVREPAEVETAPILLNPGALIAAHDSLYPAERRRGRRRAMMEMSFVVGRDGVPDSIAILRSSDRAYDAASLAIAQRMRFSPATAESRPSAVRVPFTMEWGRFWPPSSRPAATTNELYGDRPQTPEGTPVYDLWEVSWFGEPPRVLNVDALREELMRRAPGILRQGGSLADVIVELVVNRHGEIVDIRMTELTDARFAQETLEAVQVLQFSPGQMFGGTVDVLVRLPIQWN
ncbi:MAG TPA: TonB family protein [Longimicrobium sp.]|nr:TonB family protein [Longimicrobium sp.]